MLKSLRISNYRAFHKLGIDELSRINLISGRNNSGKTTLLEALLLLSAGHPEITMHTAIIRGMKSERLPPAAIPSIYWRQMFKSFDFRTPIEISAKHESGGSLSMTVEMERDEIVKTSLTASNEVLLGEELQDPKLLATIRSDDEDWQRRIQVTDKEIHMERRHRPVLFPAWIVPSGLGDLRSDAECLDALKKQKQAHRVVDALRIVDPSLTSLEVISQTGSPMIWADMGLSELVPLPTVGEGMVRVSRLAMCMVLARGGVLLVDEIENGIHHSIAADIWRFILDVVRELDVQVFATTHSYECVQAAQSLHSDDLMLHRLEASEEGHRCFSYHREHIDTAVRHSLEVR
ncbi:MAG: AAA family ATPase [Spirochaetaceae bacterium]|nr:AAA family ATPase [Spirochaetaceae bacterium]MDE0445563.1 AAA family ATPase [Spirochaetaceae bacterium]